LATTTVVKGTESENLSYAMQELLALLDAGPPPLSALALNRCDLTESSISALATACPNLEVYISTEVLI
jgi:hypothetical protein